MLVRLLTASALLFAPVVVLAKPPDLPNSPKVICAPPQIETAPAPSPQTGVEIDIVFELNPLVEESNPSREEHCPSRCRSTDNSSASETVELPGSALDNLDKLRRAREFYAQGEFYRQAGRAGAALFCFETVKRLCPGSPLAAQAEERMKDIAVAPATDTAEEAEPKSVVEPVGCPYLIDRAECETDASLRQKADSIGDPISNLQKLEKAEQLYRRAVFHQKSGRDEQAAACFEEICRLCPGSRYSAMASTELKQMVATRTTSRSGTTEEQETSRREQVLEAQLDKRITIHFHDAPLRQVLEDVRILTGLNVAVDSRNLEAEGYHLETPVTLKLRDVPTKNVLNLALRQVGLTHVVQDEVVLVTTKSAAPGQLIAKTYSVADLVMPRKKGSPAESLIHLLQTVAPQSWKDHGGRGSMEYHPLGMSLVVHQTADVHEQIAATLAALREYTNRATADDAEEQEPRKPVRSKKKKVSKGSEPIGAFIEPPLPKFDSGVLVTMHRLLIEMTDAQPGGVALPQPSGEEEAEMRLIVEEPGRLILRSEQLDAAQFATAVEELRSAMIDRLATVVCAEVDHTRGPTRGRLNVQVGGLNVRATWDAEGHGSMSVGIPVTATDGGLAKLVEWMSSLGRVVSDMK